MFSSVWTWAKERSDIDDTGYSDLNTQIENDYGRRLADQRADQPAERLLAHPDLLRFRSLRHEYAGRPDMVKTSLRNPRDAAPWFDTSAFAPPPANAGRFGNAGRGTIEGPGFLLANLAAEDGADRALRRLRAGGLFQNVLNHANMGDPVAGSDIGTAIVANANAEPRGRMHVIIWFTLPGL